MVCFSDASSQNIVILWIAIERSPLAYGVPQGSVLGPFLFCTYSHSLSEIFHRYEIAYQIYADDIKFYISMSAGDTGNVDRWHLFSKLSTVLEMFLFGWLRTG